MNRNFIYILMLTSALVSCKKDEVEQTDAIVFGEVMLHLHNYVDEEEVQGYGFPYSTVDGRNIYLELSQFYISEIELERTDGTIYKVPGKKVLKVQEFEAYEVGEVPVGNYRSVRFKVGLDPATNAVFPSSSQDSLVLNRPEMWFGNTPQPEGYIFLSAKGSIDTTSDLSNGLAPFEFNIGTNAHYVQVVMPDKNFSVLKDEVALVHMKANVHGLFSGIDITKLANLKVSTASDNTRALANQIATNISGIFSYEE